MKRRLNLGVAIVHRPRLLLLDEPTTGVDPQSRNHIFERVRELNAAGLTIIYTSHYMEEVQTLCPRIGILDHGRLIACDTRETLLRKLEGAVRLTVARNAQIAVERWRSARRRIVSVEGNTINLKCPDVSSTLVHAVNAMRDLDVELTGIETREPNLEDVFLHLTEKTLRD